MKETIAALERAAKALKTFPWPSIVLILLAIIMYVVSWLRLEITERKVADQTTIEATKKTIQAQDERDKVKDELYQKNEEEITRLKKEASEHSQSSR